MLEVDRGVLGLVPVPVLLPGVGVPDDKVAAAAVDEEGGPMVIGEPESRLGCRGVGVREPGNEIGERVSCAIGVRDAREGTDTGVPIRSGGLAVAPVAAEGEATESEGVAILLRRQ
jgi:hypothetical protein